MSNSGRNCLILSKCSFSISMSCNFFSLDFIIFFFQDLYPVFCMDFSDDYLAALEWNATYNNVHAGNILVFPMLESRLLENLSEELTSFTACRFLQEETSSTKLLTGGHDKFVSLNLTSFYLLIISFLDLVTLCSGIQICFLNF